MVAAAQPPGQAGIVHPDLAMVDGSVPSTGQAAVTESVHHRRIDLLMISATNALLPGRHC